MLPEKAVLEVYSNPEQTAREATTTGIASRRLVTPGIATRVTVGAAMAGLRGVRADAHEALEGTELVRGQRFALRPAAKPLAGFRLDRRSVLHYASLAFIDQQLFARPRMQSLSTDQLQAYAIRYADGPRSDNHRHRKSKVGHPPASQRG